MGVPMLVPERGGGNGPQKREFSSRKWQVYVLGREIRQWQQGHLCGLVIWFNTGCGAIARAPEIGGIQRDMGREEINMDIQDEQDKKELCSVSYHVHPVYPC